MTKLLRQKLRTKRPAAEKSVATCFSSKLPQLTGKNVDAAKYLRASDSPPWSPTN
jgi:hypothetical protein